MKVHICINQIKMIPIELELLCHLSRHSISIQKGRMGFFPLWKETKGLWLNNKCNREFKSFNPVCYVLLTFKSQIKLSSVKPDEGRLFILCMARSWSGMGKVKEREREGHKSVSHKSRSLISLQGKKRCCKLLTCKWRGLDHVLILFGGKRKHKSKLWNSRWKKVLPID